MIEIKFREIEEKENGLKFQFKIYQFFKILIKIFQYYILNSVYKDVINILNITYTDTDRYIIKCKNNTLY